jgi:hypothetical protein
VAIDGHTHRAPSRVKLPNAKEKSLLSRLK